MSTVLAMQEGVPQSFVKFIVSEYQRAMMERNGELQRQQQGEAANLIDAEGEVAKLTAFVQFAEAYMNQHRPAQINPADQNYIVRLTNMSSFMLAPATQALPGSMQPNNAVMVTGSQLLPEQASQPVIVDQGPPIHQIPTAISPEAAAAAQPTEGRRGLPLPE